MLLDAGNVAIAVYDGTALLYSSKAYLALFGFAEADDLRAAMADGRFQLPDPANKHQAEHFELRVSLGAGADRWIEFSRRPITWGNGPALLVTAHDITRHKRREMGLSGKESALRRLIDSSPALIGLIDREGLYSFVNQRLADLLGGMPDILIGTPAAATSGDAGFRISAEALSLARDGQQVTLQTELLSKSGRKLVFENHYRPQFIDGKIRGVCLVAFDVTERVASLAALRASEKRFRKLIQIVPFGIARVDRMGHILQTNSAYDSMLGYELGENNGRRIWEFYAAEERLQKREAFFRALYVPDYTTVARCQRKDGRLIDVLVNWRHEHDDNGEVCGMIVMLTDTTADFQARRELQTAKDAAERATFEKSRFLAAASHDLQQPLHSLSILLDLLSSQMDGPRRHEILSLMGRAIDGARELVRGVIDISKLDAGVVVPRIETFPLAELFNQVEAELAPLTAGRPVDLRLVPTSVWVRSDRLLLKSILHNLVSNAIRYTPQGKIVIGVRRRGSMVSLQVLDSGSGIPEDKFDQIFKEFVRLAHAQDEDKSPGLGLGLSIVERSCTLLGHALAVKSEPGRGSAFSVELPFIHMANQQEPQRTVPPLMSFQQFHGRILLVEDNSMTALATRQLIESWGHQCMVALCEADAMRIIGAADQRPDLILADYNLADGENGIRVIDRIINVIGAPVPSILMTANDGPDCQEAARLRGIPVIQKPANPARLRALLSYYLTTRNELA